MAYSRPEPLRGKHSLEGFCCGDDSLDTWLLRHARHAEAAGSARTFVTGEGERVIAHAEEGNEGPAAAPQRGRPALAISSSMRRS